MSELTPIHGSQSLIRSTRIESPAKTTEFQLQAVSVGTGIILQKFDTAEVKSYPETRVRTPRSENPYKLNDLVFRLNVTTILFLNCLLDEKGFDNQRIGTIVTAIDRAVMALVDSKNEINNLIGQPNSSDPLANLHNLETLLTNELLTIFKIINKTEFDSANEPLNRYIKRLKGKFEFLGVDSEMTEENLKFLGNHDVLRQGPTRLGELFAQIRECINPEHKI